MAEDVSKENTEAKIETVGIMSSLFTEIVTSPLNLFLLSICIILIYKIIQSYRAVPPIPVSSTPPTSKMKRHDMNLEELRKYDGTGEDGRICIGVNGKVFDVTRGKRFYGPGAAYSAFAGHDATRALATFSVEVTETYDDLSDLTTMQMESVKEWEIQMNERYDYVGRLLKPDELPQEYSENEDEEKED